jgi:branched-chain amino acid transport system substrate-binding protein
MTAWSDLAARTGRTDLRVESILRRLRPLAVALVVAGVLAALVTPASAANGALGTPDKASGTPVKVAFVSEGVSSTNDASYEIPIWKATVKYINQYLKGFGGHPVEATYCSDNGTAAGGQQCANEAVQNGSAVAMNAIAANPASIVPTITGAGIPWVTYAAGSPPELFGQHAYSVSAAVVSIFGGVGAYALDKGYKNIAALSIDVPNSTAAFEGIGKPMFAEAGLTLDVNNIAPNTPDMTAQVTAALSKDPDAFWIFGNDAFCIPAVKAIKTLSPDTPIFLLSNCISSTFVKDAPDINGSLVSVTTDLRASASDMKLCKAVFKQYGVPKKYQCTDQTAQQFSVPISVARALQGATQDVTTAAGLEAGLKGAQPADLALGGKITFQCNGEITTFSPNICSNGGNVATLNSKGQQKKVEEVDLSTIFP